MGFGLAEIRVPGDRWGGSASNAHGICGKSEVIPVRAIRGSESSNIVGPLFLPVFAVFRHAPESEPMERKRHRARILSPAASRCSARRIGLAEDVDAKRRQGHRPPSSLGKGAKMPPGRRRDRGPKVQFLNRSAVQRRSIKKLEGGRGGAP